MIVEAGLGDWAVERLKAEIALGSAHLAAAECRWLRLVAEFDRREAWRHWGCLSAAHWLNYRCSLALGPAREKVRVARRLEQLPAVAAAFSTGELSYSKVRALTRVATAANQEALVDLARSMTASHLERVVRTYRQLPDDDPAEEGDRTTERACRRRRLDYRWAADGMLEIRALLPAEEGALVLAALRRAADHLFRHPADTTAAPAADPGDTPAGTSEPAGTGFDLAGDDRARTPKPTAGPGADCASGDVPAGTPKPATDPADHVLAGTSESIAGGGAGDWWDAVAAQAAGERDAWDDPAPPFEVPGEAWEDDFWYPGDNVPGPDTPADGELEGDPAEEWRARHADALVAVAATVVADGLRLGSGPSRYHVVIHLNTTAGDAATPAAFIDHGPILDADTARRLMCDASLSFALHDTDGTVTNVSPKAPTVPAALSRAVKLRDDGCVFPGCTRQSFTDMHHIHHRADGGINSLTNLASLCQAHHVMIHRDGYHITAAAGGGFEFRRPDGTVIANPAAAVAAGDDTLRQANTQAGVHPGEETQTPDWDGSRPNHALIIDYLLHLDGRLHGGPDNEPDNEPDDRPDPPPDPA